MAKFTRLSNRHRGRQDTDDFENNFAAIECSRFDELPLSARTVAFMRWLRIVCWNVAVTMARWLGVGGCFMDWPGESFNKTRTPALQVDKHQKDQHAGQILHFAA